MKSKKKVLSITGILVLLLVILCVVVGVYTKQGDDLSPETTDIILTEQSTEEVSEGMKTSLDNFFAGNGTAYDKDGKDITEEVYEGYIDEYNAGNYSAIAEGMLNSGVARIKTSSK